MTETYGDWERPASGPTRQSDALARHDALRRELDRLYDELGRLASEMGMPLPENVLPIRRGALRHLRAGLFAGFVGSAAALLLHVIGSLVVGQYPLQIVRVYLTFPFGDRALVLQTGPQLALGACLYLLTGSVYGILFHIALLGPLAGAPGIWRFLLASALGIVIWGVNFYLILSWLQPLVTGGHTILTHIPHWLAALSHLVYAWAVLAVENRGRPIAGRVV